MAKSIIAICYDFDKTLSPDDMQAQGFIQSLHLDVNDFWNKSNKMAEENGMDQNLAYMYTMSQESRGKQWITKKSLAEYGAKIKFFDGVEEWFNRINKYAQGKSVSVEHYIISSGLKEMIEGTSIANEFKCVYACSFFYSEHEDAIWPAQSVNYTNKTQYLFRIEKGLLNIFDQRVNTHFQYADMRIPFSNMIYIGDSDTDVPCMKLVNQYGGYSIGVYDPKTCDKTKVLSIYKDGRIKLFAKADYSDGSKLDLMVKAIIDKIAASQSIDNFCIECENESTQDNRTEGELAKENLILRLKESHSFARTHEIINSCYKYANWSQSKIHDLCSIAMSNSQVSSILSDDAIKNFYNKILQGKDTLNDEVCEAVKVKLKVIDKNYLAKDNFLCNIVVCDIVEKNVGGIVNDVLPINLINEGKKDFSINNIYLGSDKNENIDINQCLFNGNIKPLALPVCLKQGCVFLVNVDVDKVHEILGFSGVNINAETSYGKLNKMLPLLEAEIKKSEKKRIKEQGEKIKAILRGK